MAKRNDGRKGEHARPATPAGVAGAEDGQPPVSGIDALARSVDANNNGVEAAASLSLNQDPQLIQDFLVEARDHLSTIERCVLEIEQGAATGETLHSAFRSFHTIKGLAGFLDFEVLQEVAHEVETLLDLARNGELALTPSRIDVILSAGDYISGWLNHIEGVQPARPGTHLPLVARIHEAAFAGAGPAAEAEPEPPPPAESETVEPPPAGPALTQADAVHLRGEASLIKVATDKLEYLVDMVGELVIAQSMLRHNQELATLKTPRLQRDIAQLGRVTAEVQKTAMAMRMVPVGQLFRKMTRLVRDLAKRSGKRAEIELAGEETELDRTIVEELADPLVHMIRNSMDHGLESPPERLAAGKTATGRLRLKAEHKAGMIVIELADDGRGLNRDKIVRRAIERGLVKAGAELPDQEVWQLIFHPGFSTAEKVTEVSGRGVGMDVVRKHVEKMRGRIEIESRSGQGTTFQLKLPLTLAIIDGLVVEASGERYIVPIFAVREMLKPTPEMLFTVEGRREMMMVRERLLPLVRLSRRLGLKERSADACDGLIIVGESEGREFCLLVDALAGKQEVVIKTLGPAFASVEGLAGGAILGDGRIGLILDMNSLCRSQPGGLAHA